MPSFNMNTRPETFVPLIHCVIDDSVPSHARPSSDAGSVHRRHELGDCRKCMSVHASMPKKDILAFNVTYSTH